MKIKILSAWLVILLISSCNVVGHKSGEKTVGIDTGTRALANYCADELGITNLRQLKSENLKIPMAYDFVNPSDRQDPDGSPIDATLAYGICDLFALGRISTVKRPVFNKDYACSKATFEVAKNLAEDYEVGIFKKGKVYDDVLVRISGDTGGNPDDHTNTIGMAVKIRGIDEPQKLILNDESIPAHDILTQDFPYFFAENAKEFLAGFASESFIAQYPESYKLSGPQKIAFNKRLEQLKNNEKEQILQETFHSTTPYRFAEHYVKYMFSPCHISDIEWKIGESAEYLTDNLREAISRGRDEDFCFKLQIIIANEQDLLTLDQAAVEWSPGEHTVVELGKLQLDLKNMDKTKSDCQSLAFTAWHSYPEHRPVGSVNKARGVIYRLSANKRLEQAKPVMDTIQ